MEEITAHVLRNGSSRGKTKVSGRSRLGRVLMCVAMCAYAPIATLLQFTMALRCDFTQLKAIFALNCGFIFAFFVVAHCVRTDSE